MEKSKKNTKSNSSEASPIKENVTNKKENSNIKDNLELLVIGSSEHKIAEFKKHMMEFTNTFVPLIKDYNKDMLLLLNSISMEKDSIIAENNSGLYYGLKIKDKCLAILFFDYQIIRTFIGILLGSKAPLNDKENDSRDITEIEKNLLALVIEMIIKAFNTKFSLDNMSYYQISKIDSYIKTIPIIAGKFSFEANNGGVSLFIYPDLFEQLLAEKNSTNYISANNAVKELMLELKCCTKKKKIHVSDIAKLNVDDVIKFGNDILIFVNGSQIGMGEIGHSGNNIAVRCTVFNKA